jgi:hypothetical protein
VKVHPDGTGALKKTDHRPLENPVEAGTQKFRFVRKIRG